MNAGVETSNSFGYARTAYSTCWANMPVPGACPAPSLRRPTSLYSLCHAHTGSLKIGYPPTHPGLGPAPEANYLSTCMHVIYSVANCCYDILAV